jgi:hypothetical protein
VTSVAAPIDLHRRPDARAESVEDLVAAVLRGEVRIPVFQRGLAWTAENVLELFDSIYRGYPIGSLLLRRGPGKAGRFTLGPLELHGEETAHAQWVVDGQQRLTSLAAGLARPGAVPATPTDPFAVYFDAAARSFQAPSPDGKVPTSWVPLPRLLSGSELSEWVHAWPHGAEPAMRAAVFDAGRRLREYKVPVYVIETDDEGVLRTIFHRVNNSGKALTWRQVHDALFGHKGAEPSSLGDLAEALEGLGMGRPVEESQLLPCLVALRGLDVTRSFGEHLRTDPAVLEGVAAEAAPVLREVLGFLRTHAEIPHLRLLPSSTPLPVLARFFQQHPEPNPRTRTLLVRWIWRSFLATDLDDRAVRRRGVAAISDDEEASAQSLLELIPDGERASFAVTAFDARSAHSRLAMLGLASLRPRLLSAELPTADFAVIDVPALLRGADRDAFRAVFTNAAHAVRSEANRLLLPGEGAAAKELAAFIVYHGNDHPVLASHAISPACADAVANRQIDEAIAARETTLATVVLELSDRLAEWDRTDRPSIEYLLAQAAK